MQSLTEVKAGTECTIKWMFGAPQVMELMNQYDIKEGSTISVFGQGWNSTIIGRDDVRLAIGSEIAACIKV